MKKFYMFALIAMGVAMVSCSDDLANDEVMLPDDVVEMENWIREQNGEFNDSDFIETLVHGVFDIVDQDLYTIDGEYVPGGDMYLRIDGGPGLPSCFIFNEDGTLLACYNSYGYLYPGAIEVNDGFLKGEWTYDEKSRVLTYSWLNIDFDPTTPQSKEIEVKYFKDNTAIMDEKRTLFENKGWVERIVRSRVKFDVIDREEALAKYVNDINDTDFKCK